MMSAADADASCVGGQRHVPVKFGVSARSGCFLESAAAHLLRGYLQRLFSAWSPTKYGVQSGISTSGNHEND